MKTCLIIGATGLVGRHLVEILLDDSYYDQITILVRSSNFKLHPKLRVVICNFDQLEDYQNYFSVNDFYCAMGTTIKTAKSKDVFRKVDFEYSLNAARMAKKKNVKKCLFVSAVGADPKSNFFYSKTKGELEKALVDLKLNFLGIVRPSLLLGERSEVRMMEKVAQKIMPKINPLIFGPYKKYRAINARDVAKSLFSLAKGEDVSEGLEYFTK